MKPETSYDIWIIPGTHWDRDWYRPFESFRARLVEMVDKLLTTLENDKTYNAFSFDGQTIVLEDYLQIRPEQESVVKKHIRNGRLAVGPWYVMPDMYLVSGESMIRNLLIGEKIARSFGHEPMMVGYVPDPFGHPETIPSIFAGFGIRHMLYMRGSSKEVQDLGVVSLWQAPDGARVIITRQVLGYSGLCMWGVPDGHATDSNIPDFEKASRMLQEGIKAFEHNNQNVNTLLIHSGSDHFPLLPTIPKLIAFVQKQFPGFTFHQGTIEDYARAVDKHAPQLKTYRGELHGSWHKASMLSGTFSARMWIKMENFICQRLLEQIIEPTDAIQGILQHAAASPLLPYAWKELLKTHPHDDICGCSVDAVHNDTRHQFDHVKQVAQEAVRIAFKNLATGFDKSIFPDKKPLIVAFNPEPRTRAAQITVSYEYLENIYSQPPLPKTTKDLCVLTPDGRRLPVDAKDRTLTFWDDRLPAMGYTAYTLEEQKHAFGNTDLKAHGNTIENRFLKATLKPDGTVVLRDKQIGETFTDLNAFEYIMDAGDSYDFAPVKLPAITLQSVRGNVHIAKVNACGAEVTCSVHLKIPGELNETRNGPSSRKVSIPVEITIRLRPDVRRLEFTTTIDNCAKDYRLRVLFPTAVKSDHLFASSHFTITRRPIDPLPKNMSKKDRANNLEAPTHCLNEFVAVQEKKSGVLIASLGLPEYEGIASSEGVVLALTLLRCTGWISRNDHPWRGNGAGPQLAAPEAQCQGRFTFSYAFIPYKGDLVSSGSAECGREFGIPTMAATVSLSVDQLNSCTGSLPVPMSFLTIENNAIVLSACKRAEGNKNLMIRLYNWSGKTIQTGVNFTHNLLEVHSARLDETLLDKLPHTEKTIRLSFKPHEIKTLSVSFDI